MTSGHRRALALACAAGLALRVIGLQFGLPSVYNPDEAAIMARALSFAKGTLNPENFLYPTFYFYVLFVWVGAYLGLLLLTGQAESVAALQALFFTDPTPIYTAGRILGVAAGVATLVALHRLGARLFDTRTALAAAIFLTVAPLHVRDSHYVKHDVPATLAVVLAYLAIARVWPGAAAPDGRSRLPANRDVLVAGAACGVAFSTHYYCIFLGVPLAGAVAASSWRDGLGAAARRIAAAALASALVFFALSPFIALEPLTAWRDITGNRAIVIDRAVEGGAFSSAARYLRMLLFDSAGFVVITLAAAGAVWMLARDRARALLLLSFPLTFALFIFNTAPASRYLTPVLPFCALFAAWTLARAAQGRRLRPAVFWMLVAAAAAPSLAASVRAGLFFREADTRALAESFVHQRIPAGAAVAIQPHSVMLTPSREWLAELLARGRGGLAGISTKHRIQLALDPYPAPAYRLVYLGSGGLDPDKLYIEYTELGGSHGLTRLRELSVAFVIVKRYNKPDPATVPFLTALAAEARLVAAFSPYRPGTSEAERARVDPFLHNTDTPIDDGLKRPGPTLEIWELNGAGN